MTTETKVRRVEPDITVLEISGRLNLGNSLVTVETSIRRLAQEGSRKIVIDFADLIAIDSSGIGVLMRSSSHIKQNGGQIRIAGPQGALWKVLGMFHVDRIGTLDADVEASCRNFKANTASV